MVVLYVLKMYMNENYFSKLPSVLFVKGYLISTDKCLTDKLEIPILSLRKINPRIFSKNKKRKTG